MGVLTLNPISIYNFGRGSWGASTGTLGASTVNSTNGVYARLNSQYPNVTNGASLKFKVAGGQLPGGAKVEYMRPGFVIKSTNIVSPAGEGYFRAMIQNIRGGNGKGSNAVTWSGQLKLTTSFSTIYGVSEKTTKSNNIVYGDGSITQTDINSLVVEVFDIVNPVVQIDRMWIEVSYDEKPTISINAPGTISETTSPIITFDYDDDKMPLDAIDVELYNDSGVLLHEESKLSIDSPSYPIPIQLDDGDYSIKIRAYQQWNYAGEAPVSDWDTEYFSISIGRPAVPEFTATPQANLARVKLTVKSNLNLLGTDAAEGAPAAWNDVTNGSIYTGATYQDTAGDRSLTVELSNGASTTKVYMTGQLVPVTAGVYYAFGFNARPFTGDPAVNVQACIRWIDVNGATVSDTYGTNALEISGQWKAVVHYQQAPVGAVYAKPFITINDNTLGAWHYIDAIQFVAQATLAEPLPAWSRGGFTQDTSINLLAYGDSTLESTSHWTAAEPDVGSRAALVSVVNTTAETASSTERYQGDNMLKITTDGTLIRRAIGPNFSATTAISIGKGATEDGDLMIVFIQVQGNTTTVATPAGWTQLSSATGTSQRIYILYKFASSEASTLTFTASASGKHAIALYVWTGIDTTTPVDNFAFSSAVASVAANTPVSLSNVTVPHNAPVMQGFFGRSVARTTTVSFTSNLGGTNDILLSSTNNTAAETATGMFSRKYNTGSTTALSLTGRTLTCNAATTDVITANVVLRPDRSTVRATLKDYEYYEYDNTNTYVVQAAVYGADNGTTLNSANRAVNYIVDLYDNNKTYITGYLVGTTTGGVGIWKKLTGTLNVNQPTAKFMTVRLEVDQITDAEAYYFDAISLYEGPTNLGYVEGFKQVDGPYLEVEYSEDNGLAWMTQDDVDSIWMIQRIEDFSDATIEFYDYEIASGVNRIYRFYNWKMEENNLVQSDYSTTVQSGITFYRIWMHLVADPAGTIYQFIYDGAGRDDSYDKVPTILQFTGRQYGQVYFGETVERTINANVQLPDLASSAALTKLDRGDSLIIFRDGRGRRVKGLLSVKFSDEMYGQVANITVQVAGLQP